jgi:hypothetical protein
MSHDHNPYSQAEHGYDAKNELYYNDKGYAQEEIVEAPREEETHRSLKPRQISMIAIGGAIGELSSAWMESMSTIYRMSLTTRYWSRYWLGLCSQELWSR